MIAPAVSGHLAGLRTMDYLDQVLGHMGIDGQGAEAIVLVNAPGVPSPQAEQHNQLLAPGTFSASFGGAGTNPPVQWNHVVDFVTVAHELTHAVVDTAIGGTGLVYAGESGAVSEALSDIYAFAIEARTFGTTDWLFGDDIYISGATCDRNIADPNAGCTNASHNPPLTRTPDTRLGTYWVNSALSCNNPAAVCHDNSTVGSYWFYLLVNGCVSACVNNAPVPQAYEVKPLAPDRVMQVVHNAVRGGAVPANADFAALRAATITEAIEAFGPNSPEHINVTNAWQAVNVGDAYQEPAFSPAQAATEIDPWSATLTFDLGGTSSCGTTGYAIAIAHDPDMQTAINVPVDHFMPGKARAVVALKASTTYYWEVIDPSPENACAPTWHRKRHSFTTSAKRAVPVSPTRQRGCKAFDKKYTSGECQPWGLELSWDKATGAEEYSGEVGEYQDIENNPVVQFWNTTMLSHKTDVLVNKPHFWRVRARGPKTVFGEEPNWGAWSNASFTTIMPSTQMIEPYSSTPEPWPVNHRWSPVVAVHHFDFHLYGGTGSAFMDTRLQPHEPAVALDMPCGEDTSTQYTWDVEIVGPPLAYLQNQSEHGQPMLGNQYVVHCYTTDADIVGPAVDCMDYDASLALKWQNIEGAGHYELQLVRTVCDANGCVEADIALEDTPAAPPSDVMWVDYDGPPASALLLAGESGWAVKVRAISQQGMLGVEDVHQLNVEPPKPKGLIPADGAELTILPGTPFDIGYDHVYSHRSMAYFEMFPQFGCLGPPFWTETTYGFVNINFTLTSLAPGDTNKVSLRVRPLLVPGSQCGLNMSACHDIVLKGKEVTPEEFSIPCGDPVPYEGGLQPPPPNEVYVGNVTGYADLAINTLNIPDNVSFYYDGQLLFSFGCQGTLQTIHHTVYLNGEDDKVTVTVTPQCGLPMGDTRWGYRVGCIGDAVEDLVIELEP